MQELTQTLEELKGLHEQVFGRAAPEMTPGSFCPFPAGVDPIEHARAEARHLAQLVERVAFAPKPNAWVPLADSFVTEDAFVVRIEVPGVSREDLKVHVVGRECVVRGERKPPQCATTMRPMTLERPWGAFERRFVLPTGNGVADMTAKFSDGVLEITIPVDPVEVPKEQKIDIR